MMSCIPRLALVLLLASSVGAPAALHAQAPAPTSKVNFNIQPQPIGKALTVFGEQSGLTVIVESKLSHGLQSRAVSGAYTPDEALKQILEPAGLKAEYLDNKTVLVRSASARISANDPAQARGSSQEQLGMQLAQTQSSSLDDEHTKSSVQEIIVSAQKRDERLQDVPVPVTVLNADTLTDNNQLRLQDYFTSIPGFKIVPSVQSIQTLSIRGITTGSGNPTVGVTVDDVPYGASTNTGGGRVVPDIDPGDLARVEVLRGPQGTLYGASSMGGLLKFVTRDPSMDAFSGRIQAGTTSVSHSDDWGYNVRGSVNIPLADSWAVRASAFSRREPGFIDNVLNGEKDVNGTDAQGGRVAVLWRPSARFSLKLSALLQTIEGDGTASADAALSELQHSRLPGTGWYERDAQAYSATLAAKLGSVDFTSISGYNINSFSDSLDAGFIFGAAAQTAFGVSGAQLLSHIETKKFNQEIRFSASAGDRFQWLLGAFFTDEDSLPAFTRLAANATSGATAGQLQYSTAPETFEEYAAFGNLTINFTDRFDVQFGARHSEISETFTQTIVNTQGIVTVVPEVDVNSNAFTYLVTPRWRVTPEIMAYARLASGYRAGGPNAFPGGVIPARYHPDETLNYELGIKADLFGRLLSVDASVYHIDWKDIQYASLSANSTSYLTNGSRARSRGVELAVQSRPVEGLTLGGWVAFNDAELTEAFPAGSTAYGISGNRLPDNSRWSGNLAVDWEFPLINQWLGSIGGSASYVGHRLGSFRGLSAGVPLPRQTLDAYTQIDIRAGVRIDSWNANLFVNNLSDKRSALYGGLGALPATAFSYIQPRTVGVSVSKSF